MILKNNFMFLQLFAEAAAGNGGGDTGVKGTETVAAAQNTGDTAPAAGETNTEGQSVDRKAEFQRLISGEYKEFYDAEVASIVQKRLKRTQEVADKYTTLYPTIELIAERYGVDPRDAEALAKAVADDDAYFEEEAMKQGIPVENFKKMKQIERENAMYRQRDAQRQRDEAAQRTYQGWLDQAEKAKAVYPALDLQTEVKNHEFVRLLQYGVDVRTAYEVIHKDDIISGAMQFAQKNATEKLASSVAAGQARPAEGGMQNAPSAQTKTDVSKFTLAEMDDQVRRAARGEKFTFSS